MSALAADPLPTMARKAVEPAAGQGRRRPLLHALWCIGGDLFSTLAFAGLFALTRSARAATLLAIVAGLVQIGWQRRRGRRPDAMQLMSLALVAVFGTASLLTHDPRFVMLKPTLTYLAVGAVMLKRGWMARYMPPKVMDLSPGVVDAFGYVWAALMVATAALNAALAIADQAAWAAFITLFPLASKIALGTTQYLATRAITVRRARRRTASAALDLRP